MPYQGKMRDEVERKASSIPPPRGPCTPMDEHKISMIKPLNQFRVYRIPVEIPTEKTSETMRKMAVTHIAPGKRFDYNAIHLKGEYYAMYAMVFIRIYKEDIPDASTGKNAGCQMK